MKYQIYSILVVLSWGLNFAVSKIGLTEVPPLLLLSIRFGLAGLIFLPFAKFDRNNLFPLFKIGLTLNVGHYGFAFVALSILPGSAVAVILQSQVPIAIVLSYLFLQEKLSFKQSLGIVFAIMGILLIYGIPELSSVGLFLGLLGSFCWGITQILMKKTPHINKATYIAGTHLLSAPFLLVLSFIFERQVDWGVVNFLSFGAVLFYQVIILSLSMALWQNLISNHGVNKISPFSLLQVVFAIAGTFFILHEPLTPPIFFGAGLTLMGVWFATMKRIENRIEFTLRAATIDDVEFIFGLRVETMKPFFKNTSGWNEVKEREKAGSALTNSKIVMIDRKKSGVIKVIPRSDELHLHQMQILPELQKKGIGTELIRQTIELSEQSRIPITLFVMKNTPAKQLYEQFGFVVTHDFEHSFKMCRSPSQDV